VFVCGEYNNNPDIFLICNNFGTPELDYNFKLSTQKVKLLTFFLLAQVIHQALKKC